PEHRKNCFTIKRCADMLAGKRCAMLLVIVSALLFILAFPVTSHDISPWPFIFFALTPFFLGIEREKTFIRSFFIGAVWGAIMSLGLAYWLVYAMIWQYGISVAVTVLIIVLGLVMPHAVIYGLFAVMYRYLKDSVPGAAGGLPFYCMTVPSLWVVLEFTREIFPLVVPWGLAGYGLQPFNLYMQAADIAGIYGISFLVVVVNALIAYLARDIGLDGFKNTPLFRNLTAQMAIIGRRKRAALVVLVLAIAVPVLYGAVRREAVNDLVLKGRIPGLLISVSAVQANFTQEERWRRTGFIERVNVCLGLTRRCGATLSSPVGMKISSPDSIVVWPETVLNSSGMVDTKLFSYIQSQIGGSRLLIAGGVRRTIGSRGVFNTAFIVEKGGDALFYDKNILLPYAETAPFGRLFGDYYTAPAEFLAGGTPPAARTGMGLIGLSICFEALYPWHARRAAGEGARLLVNISNDGWFGRTSEPALHLRQASVRAIENRRFMVRTSNNGYSAIISPAGEYVTKSGLFTRECVSGDAVLLDLRTLYSRFGDWIVCLSAAVIGVLLLVVAIRVK
nr:apolipoprotein N-acyltransferase [Spirochaetota bacterium]